MPSLVRNIGADGVTDHRCGSRRALAVVALTVLIVGVSSISSLIGFLLAGVTIIDALR